MIIDGKYYGWNAIWLVCGLCKEDFDYDLIGSLEEFRKCLQVLEELAK